MIPSPEATNIHVKTRDNITYSDIIPFPFDESQVDQLTPLFSAIADIPYDVIDNGEDAVRTWLDGHGF